MSLTYQPGRGGAGGLPPGAAIAVIACAMVVTAWSGQTFSPTPDHPRTRRWYRRLDKPSFTPPGPVFGGGWGLIDTVLAYGGYRLLRQPSSPARNSAVGLWLVNNLLIAGWSGLFSSAAGHLGQAHCGPRPAPGGSTVTVSAREPVRAAAALGDPNIEVYALDLIDPALIEAFASRWMEGGHPLHMLSNSAGESGRAGADARGYETQFAINHLGHFQLTLALLPALRAAQRARVVNVSSGAQRFGRIRWDDPHSTKGYDGRAAYAQSKLANVLFAVELDRRWAEGGVPGYAVHPGVVVGTKLNSSAGDEPLRRMGLIDEAGRSMTRPSARRRRSAEPPPWCSLRRTRWDRRRRPEGQRRLASGRRDPSAHRRVHPGRGRIPFRGAGRS